MFGFTSDSRRLRFDVGDLRRSSDGADARLERSRARASAHDAGGFRQAENSPDPLVNRLADSLAYVGHPYGFSPTGTESSLRSITLAALRNYQATQMVTSRMLLVVVGNIERARLEPLVQRTLGQLPRGNYTWTPPRAPPKLGQRARRARRAAADELSARLLLRAGGARPRLPGAAHRDRRCCRAVLHGDSVAAKSVIRSRRAVSSNARSRTAAST